VYSLIALGHCCLELTAIIQGTQKSIDGVTEEAVGVVDTSQQVSSAVILSGYLYKRSDVLKQWKLRYFTLTQQNLGCYSSSSPHDLLRPRSEMSIDKNTVVESTDGLIRVGEDQQSSFCVFQVTNTSSKAKVFLLAAPDMESMLRWIKCIQCAASLTIDNEPVRIERRNYELFELTLSIGFLIQSAAKHSNARC
jgi:hypothetical protein